MAKLFVFVWLTGSVFAACGGVPSWKELQAGVQANDFERVRDWIKDDGLESNTAANALIAAAMAGDRPMLDKLLTLGISVNLTNYYGGTALIKAADAGRTEMVRHLLQRGARANAIGRCDDFNCKGHTALMGAACREDTEMAQMLLEAGADPRVANDAAVEMANQKGDVELYLLLIESGGRQRRPGSRATDTEISIPIATLGLTELLPPAAPSKSALEPRAEIRLSVIADDSNILLGDLLTARLSAQGAFALVERQELDRVLAEQNLTRHFAADAANYARIAALLRADALLLIQAQRVADTKVLESRLIRVNPGLVLDTVYASPSMVDPPAWAERMSTRVAAMAAKVSHPDAIALSLLGIRSLSSAGRGVDRTVATLVSDRLAHQPYFILLERAAMERVAAEGTGAFWAGSYLVDGTIEPALDGSGAFTLSLRFQPAGRSDPLTFTCAGNRAHPVQAIDDLMLKINSRLKQLPAPPKRNLADEAQQYFDEARWALSAQRPQLATTTAEAAWALGVHSIESARLRIAAAMLGVQQAPAQRGRGEDVLGVEGRLDLAWHALTVWREMLDDALVREKREALRGWLEFGFETIDAALLSVFQIDTVAEQAKQKVRLDRIREAVWETLEEVRKRSAQLPGGELLDNRASEKEAALARMLFPRTPDFVRHATALLTRHFKNDDVLTRARIRANLVAFWSTAVVPFQESPMLRRTVSFRLSRGDEASRQFTHQLQNSAVPEDRYVVALLALKRASARGEAAPPEVERLCASLFDLRDLLAQGGEIFERYFGLFDELDKLAGVPFFAMTRHESGNRMWERHTVEHGAFRRKLFLALMAKATKGDPQFQKMLSRDEFSPEQQAEIIEAQSRLGSATAPRAGTPRPGSGAPIIMRREARVGPAIANPPANPASAPPQEPPRPSSSPLQVRRLWHPFNLEERIAPEFRAHWPSLQWAEGRLWFNGTTLTVGGQPDRHYIFCVDPESLSTKTFAAPDPAGSLEGRLLVLPTHLLLAMREYFAVFDRAQRRWNTYGEIKLAVGPTGFLIDPVIVGESVYLVISDPPGNALISFNLRSRATEIIVSTSRRPAVSPLDDPAVRLGSIATNENCQIVVTAGKVRYAWSLANRTWNPVPSSTFKPGPPTRATVWRAGTVGQVNNLVTLRLSKREVAPVEIALTFLRPSGLYLPDSIYGPQNIRPNYCNEFAEGLVLVPNSGSGFWVIPRKEIDEYLRPPGAKLEAMKSAANP
ncbi:MAG TPA: ankyrin repeat domain-containing protein [Candidatus Saccharimonadales bacterium]|nr:ankyrin repeat domain-containing protein [Candidatus Saccharimonadales bacterium]